MDQKRDLEGFASGPVFTLVLRNAIPAMAAMLMVLIYNLADTFFIGQTHDAIQVAAVSLATPVFLIFMSVGTVFGIGGTSVISRALGEGRKEYAKKVSAFCMWGCVIAGSVMSLFFWLFMEQILGLVGATPDTWELAESYLNLVCLSGPFVLISNCFSNILRAEGQSGKAMMGQLLGNLLNIILDPIMILGFGWNIAGAAIATVIGNIVGAGYYLLYFWRGKSMLSIRLKDVSRNDKVCSSVLVIGVPASLGSLLMSVSQIVVNGQMSAYGDMALAGIGVAMKVTMITGMVCIGLGQGVQPLLGYCVGARLWERYQKILKFSLLFAFALSTVLTLACYLCLDQIIHAFLTDQNAFAYALRFARILLSTSFLFGVFYVLTNSLQAMGAAKASLIISLSRQGLIYIPALFLLQAAVGVNGLVWAQPLADVLSIILAVILCATTTKQMMRKPIETEGTIS
ncbi:MATE family efflux transporter [Intestinimonas butyriciproducens]|uniref:MATE family efflux transporter n=1 Tax=Intestinimonas butyriciproducens TaxID=1297617 RepID=UPI00051B3459|nr:MATE family efflux transporter [Intestinimonas butyriciproducens]MBS6523598.1 MATE family efflux transporter [Clostridiales bacterium]MDB7818277.1 MATE family efflux transporter [Intestinimonas butyriciproducens]MDB7844894.1 MATE family efflux transporter [Intestinimonas butyriciproducens]MDB7859249.1 MATE family efflux transporter [Intestinimonas butyriciproducens]